MRGPAGLGSPVMLDVLNDLVAEQDRLEANLSALPDEAWQTASAASG